MCFGRYAAAAECAAAVPEKTQPGGEQEQAANALEVRTTVRIEGLKRSSYLVVAYDMYAIG